jgi:hypothetical protein
MRRAILTPAAPPSPSPECRRGCRGTGEELLATAMPDGRSASERDLSRLRETIQSKSAMAPNTTFFPKRYAGPVSNVIEHEK